MIGKQMVHSQESDDALAVATAYSMSNEALHMVGLQRRRIRAEEPEDTKFVFRWWADAQFLIIALWRLRSAGELALRTNSDRASIRTAIEDFDSAVPGLRRMRNVGEHAGDYVINRGHDRDVRSESLQAGSFDGVTFGWLDGALNTDVALDAAERLHQAIKTAAFAAAFPTDEASS
jgi:hypothetical protein